MKRTIDEFKWDIFISHASEDKEEIAIPLTNLLKEKGLKVWIDDHEILIGDSLRRKIDEGLASSRFGVVILSQQFFEKEWPKKELDALVSREDGLEKIILPVWHDVTKSFIAGISPMLSDKLAITSDIGIEAISSEILKVVNKDFFNTNLFFSQQDIRTLNSAARYFRAREGNFSTSNTLNSIMNKLEESENKTRVSSLSGDELILIHKIVDENINYLSNYEYLGLTAENANKNRQDILIPLFELKKKMLS